MQMVDNTMVDLLGFGRRCKVACSSRGNFGFKEAKGKMSRALFHRSKGIRYIDKIQGGDPSGANTA